MSNKEKLENLLNKKQCYGIPIESNIKSVSNSEIANYLITNNVIPLPCKVGDTFYGVNETSYDAYCVYGFKYGKRKGNDENVLIVLTTYDMEFVWGEEAFLTEEEAKIYLDNVIKD